MDYFQILVLAIIQGLTEFLPISSSGHLVIFQKLFGLTQLPILFDVLVHVGTLGAVLFYFKQELKQIFKGFIRQEKKSVQIFWLVVVGTIPAALIGFFFEKQIEAAFGSLKVVGIAFLVTAGLLFSTKWTKPVKDRLTWRDALVIGFFQALAILPGVSRSGSTITTALWRKATRETAFRFSFYLAVPAILGALILKTKELFVFPVDNLIQGVIGLVIAGVVGYFALKILESTLKSARFWCFGFYCLVLGIIILLVA